MLVILITMPDDQNWVPLPRKYDEEIELAKLEKESRYRESPICITDVETLLQAVEDELENPQHWVFRGQVDSEWGLTPRRGRRAAPDEEFHRKTPEDKSKMLGLLGDPADPGLYELSERDEFDNWRAEALSLIPAGLPRPSASLEWLAVGQHYGLKTRLLDWTRNPLVGVFFATRTRDPAYRETADAALFALRGLGSLGSLGEDNPWRVLGVRLWYPPSLIDRIGSQSSVFTLHQMGGSGGSLDLVRYAKTDWYKYGVSLLKIRHPDSKLKLVKFTIEHKFKEKLSKQLGLLGVDEFTCFPDLAGLCRAYEGGRSRKPGFLDNILDE